MKTLILGGMRSGKSRYAEQIILKSPLQAVYIATATANDPEMAQRIQQHQQQRGTQWQNIEEPIDLLATLIQTVNSKNYVLVDCLTLWLTNLLLDTTSQLQSDTDINNNLTKQNLIKIQQQISELCEYVASTSGDVVFVSNEVGLGIVPMGELSRQFCDLTGLLHQQLAQHCDRVIFMVAGIAQVIKDPDSN